MAIEQRPARRPGRERCRVLDAAVHLTATRPIERQVDRRHHAERDTRPVTTSAEGEDDIAGLGQLLGPGRWCDRSGVDLEHDEIAVFVGAGHRTLLGTSVGVITSYDILWPLATRIPPEPFLNPSLSRILFASARLKLSGLTPGLYQPPVAGGMIDPAGFP